MTYEEFMSWPLTKRRAYFIFLMERSRDANQVPDSGMYKVATSLISDYKRLVAGDKNNEG